MPRERLALEASDDGFGRRPSDELGCGFLALALALTEMADVVAEQQRHLLELLVEHSILCIPPAARASF